MFLITCDFIDLDPDDPNPMCWCEYPFYDNQMTVCRCTCHEKRKNVSTNKA